MTIQKTVELTDIVYTKEEIDEEFSGLPETYTKNEIDEIIANLPEPVSSYITDAITKTVASETSVDPSAFDFASINDAFFWVATQKTSGVGRIDLMLDEGLHKVGGDGLFNEEYWAYFVFESVHLNINTYYPADAVLTYSDYDDGGNYPSMIFAKNSEISVSVICDPAPGGYPYPTESDFMYTENSQIQVTGGGVGAFSVAYYIDKQSVLEASYITFSGTELAVGVSGRSIAYLNGSTIENGSRGISVSGYGSAALISGASITGQTYYAMEASTGGQVIYGYLTLSENSQDANIPLNTLQPDMSFIKAFDQDLIIPSAGTASNGQISFSTDTSNTNTNYYDQEYFLFEIPLAETEVSFSYQMIVRFEDPVTPTDFYYEQASGIYVVPNGVILTSVDGTPSGVQKSYACAVDGLGSTTNAFETLAARSDMNMSNLVFRFARNAAGDAVEVYLWDSYQENLMISGIATPYSSTSGINPVKSTYVT